MTTAPIPRAVISARAAVTTVAAVFASGLVIDAGTKVLAVHTLDPDNPTRVLGGLLTLQLIRNPGAAFSIGEGFTWIFTILATVALTLILTLLVPRIRHRGWAFAVGLITAGIAGNLIDRVSRPPGPFRGHVIDFLQLPQLAGYQWPIFNVADICVTSGALLVAWLAVVRRVDWDGLTEAQRQQAAGPVDAGGATGGDRNSAAADADDLDRPADVDDPVKVDGAVTPDDPVDPGDDSTSGDSKGVARR